MALHSQRRESPEVAAYLRVGQPLSGSAGRRCRRQPGLRCPRRRRCPERRPDYAGRPGRGGVLAPGRRASSRRACQAISDRSSFSRRGAQPDRLAGRRSAASRRWQNLRTARGSARWTTCGRRRRCWSAPGAEVQASRRGWRRSCTGASTGIIACSAWRYKGRRVLSRRCSRSSAGRRNCCRNAIAGASARSRPSGSSAIIWPA